MRKRSDTIYAQSIEEFNVAADIRTVKNTPQSQHFQRGKSCRSLTAISHNTPVEKRTTTTAKTTDDTWDDFEFGCDRKVLERKGSSRNSLETDTTETETPDGDNLLEVNKTLIVKKMMVIGQRGAGKHYLVNSTFQSEDNQNSFSVTQTMDFILKTEGDELFETKYHFWIRELNEHKFDALIKVYYKTISVFIFVYSTSDRNSFEALNEAIKEVKREVPSERFVGVLLANSSDANNEHHQHPCEVSRAEGVALKEKHNLAFFSDSNESEALIRQQLLQVLNK